MGRWYLTATTPLAVEGVYGSVVPHSYHATGSWRGVWVGGTSQLPHHLLFTNPCVHLLYTSPCVHLFVHTLTCTHFVHKPMCTPFVHKPMYTFCTCMYQLTFTHLYTHMCTCFVHKTTCTPLVHTPTCTHFCHRYLSCSLYSEATLFAFNGQ